MSGFAAPISFQLENFDFPEELNQFLCYPSFLLVLGEARPFEDYSFFALAAFFYFLCMHIFLRYWACFFPAVLLALAASLSSVAFS
mmetsp:Transcript_17983/g.52135  ORF Transcript_17983/g.52135 Transcript_17983/m.52135 type:complete len:86 (-) Transcript_17983:370-627(-)